jgi:tetratricopeptide (TPR) repeat protein
MKNRLFYTVVLATALAALSPRAQTGKALLREANREIRDFHYADAESTLNLLAATARGEELNESLFLLAGLKSSAADASRLYQRIIDDDPGSDWAKRAQLELSKIKYALGEYEESFRILDDSDACEVSEEACLFQGLSAIMLKRYPDARRPLGEIRRGRYRTWAYLSLAEVESGMNRPDAACSRYEALANAMIIPTALYRHGECLENRGEVRGAEHEYQRIIENFRDTPEAVLAAEKLARLANRSKTSLAAASDTLGGETPPHQEVLTSGYTIQFGSFRDRGNAIKLSAKIKRVYPGVRIDSELINYREYHRVRFGYFKTRQEAQAKAEEISRNINEDYTIMTLP